MNTLIYLKIKIKHLAEEARIIRDEEKKHAGDMRNSLTEHRKQVVRREARATQLAYAFLRGKKYSDLEKNPRTQPSWYRVKRMVEKYGTNVETPLGAWRKGE